MRGTPKLPGRKSDVQESQWLLKLHTYGLLRNSFRPLDQIRPCAACALARPSREEAARAAQHMQKACSR